MRIHELLETATTGATSAGDVETGPVAAFKADKSYTGSPGKPGTKAPKQGKVKMQKPTDNALNSKTGLMTGQGNIIKR
jgi:hypothetical protein